MTCAKTEPPIDHSPANAAGVLSPAITAKEIIIFLLLTMIFHIVINKVATKNLFQSQITKIIIILPIIILVLH